VRSEEIDAQTAEGSEENDGYRWTVDPSSIALELGGNRSEGPAHIAAGCRCYRYRGHRNQCVLDSSDAKFVFQECGKELDRCGSKSWFHRS